MITTQPTEKIAIALKAALRKSAPGGEAMQSQIGDVSTWALASLLALQIGAPVSNALANVAGIVQTKVAGLFSTEQGQRLVQGAQMAAGAADDSALRTAADDLTRALDALGGPPAVRQIISGDDGGTTFSRLRSLAYSGSPVESGQKWATATDSGIPALAPAPAPQLAPAPAPQGSKVGSGEDFGPGGDAMPGYRPYEAPGSVGTAPLPPVPPRPAPPSGKPTARDDGGNYRAEDVPDQTVADIVTRTEKLLAQVRSNDRAYDLLGRYTYFDQQIAGLKGKPDTAKNRINARSIYTSLGGVLPNTPKNLQGDAADFYQVARPLSEDIAADARAAIDSAAQTIGSIGNTAVMIVGGVAVVGVAGLLLSFALRSSGGGTRRRRRDDD